jgi:hypothetical protein
MRLRWIRRPASASGRPSLWTEIGEAFVTELAEAKTTVQDFLKRLNPAWNVVGRVHFNLAENRKDAQAPFAFLATYTNRLSAHGKAQHLPLGQALREYAGAANKERLLSLLLPVQRAAERCAWLKQMVDAGEIFHPLRWSPQEAFRFLEDVIDPDRDLHGTLRPYQQAGVRWLHLLSRLGLGACRTACGARTCWWPRRRCSPTGPRSSNGSHPGLRP